MAGPDGSLDFEIWVPSFETRYQTRHLKERTRLGLKLLTSSYHERMAEAQSKFVNGAEDMRMYKFCPTAYFAERQLFFYKRTAPWFTIIFTRVSAQVVIEDALLSVDLRYGCDFRVPNLYEE